MVVNNGFLQRRESVYGKEMKAIRFLSQKTNMIYPNIIVLCRISYDNESATKVAIRSPLSGCSCHKNLTFSSLPPILFSSSLVAMTTSRESDTDNMKGWSSIILSTHVKESLLPLSLSFSTKRGKNVVAHFCFRLSKASRNRWRVQSPATGQ